MVKLQAPLPFAAAAAQQRCTVKHLDRCVGFRRPAQGQDTCGCNAVANRAGIRRERSNRRRSRRHCVDRHAQRTRGSTGVAGGIGGGSGEAVAAVGERRRRIGPGPAAVGHRRCPAASHRQTP